MLSIHGASLLPVIFLEFVQKVNQIVRKGMGPFQGSLAKDAGARHFLQCIIDGPRMIQDLHDAAGMSRSLIDQGRDELRIDGGQEPTY